MPPSLVVEGRLLVVDQARIGGAVLPRRQAGTLRRGTTTWNDRSNKDRFGSPLVKCNPIACYWGSIMNVDLSKFTAAELDELMSKAAERRAKLTPAHPTEVPKTGLASVDPAYYTMLIPQSKGQIAINLRHPGYGWLAFAIPPHEAANIIRIWSLALAVAASGQDGTLPAPTVPAEATGGNIH